MLHGRIQIRRLLEYAQTLRRVGIAPFGELIDQRNLDERRLLLLQRLDSELLNRLIDNLLTPYREILVLREIEELSYREIADVLALPIGTVMSRLARAREKLQCAARGSVTPRLVK